MSDGSKYIAGRAYSAEELARSAEWQRARRRHCRWAIGWVAAATALLLVYGILVFAGQIAPPARTDCTLLLLVLLIFFSSALGASYIASGRHLVLWLRRFNRPDQLRIRFDSLLSAACAYYATPITVRDRVIPASQFYLLFNHPLRFMSFLGGFFGPPAVVGFAPRLFTGAESSFEWFLLVQYLWAIPGLILVIRNLRRRSAVVLRGERGLRAVDRLIRRVRSCRGSLWGIAILDSDKAIWKKVVERCTKVSSVVVMDITELSPNLHWELDRVYAHKPPDQVILLYRASDSKTEIPPESLENAAQLVPAEYLAQCLKFVYPSFHQAAQPGVAARKSLRLSPELVTRFDIVFGLAAANAELSVMTDSRFGLSFDPPLTAQVQPKQD